MIVYLIRHGETEYNKQKRLQGQSDIALNEYGKELARLTAQGMDKIRFDYVFSSPLQRALETAGIVACDSQVPVITDERIQEIGFGEYEGLCFGADGYNIPDKNFLHFFEAPELYIAPPGGEKITDVINRTGEFWRELTENPKYSDSRILVSTHGCALKAMLANIRRLEIKDFWGEGVHKNCAVTIVNVSDGKATILEEGKVFY